MANEAMKTTDAAAKVRKILRPGGLIAQHLTGYEHRPQQLTMAEAVVSALSQEEHLIVEAGTGVGKSFAYLVPAIVHALTADEKVVISTNTINLQEQLIYKDIPFLKKVIGEDFKVALAEGRGNYLSIRRYRRHMEKGRGIFDRESDINELDRIKEWASHTSDGNKASIEPQPSPPIWLEIASDRHDCLGKECPTYSSCFYFKMRKLASQADLIITNHHLLFTDLEIKIKGGIGVLPNYSYLILDEAHHIEAVVTKQFGIELSNSRVERFLNSLYNANRNKGLFIRKNSPTELVDDTWRACDNQFAAIRQFTGGSPTRLVESTYFVENLLSEPLSKIGSHLKALSDTADSEDDKQEISAHKNRCDDIRTDFELMLDHSRRDHVYWIEGNHSRNVLRANPLNVGDTLKEILFEKKKCVIMTSATLSTNQNFDHYRNRLGLTQGRSLLVGSPFKYQQQVKYYCPPDMPNPNSPDFTEAAASKISGYLKLTHGKAFVLFTSYRMMDEVYQVVQPYMEQLGIAVIKQGEGISRSAMLTEFKQNVNSVLFGTASFWEGVDVQGESLSCVIIVKLPFEVPTHPLVAAKHKRIEAKGGNPFSELSLPEAIIRFKQGFGRLIRTKTDTGIFVVLDPRINTKAYGKQFWRSINVHMQNINSCIVDDISKLNDRGNNQMDYRETDNQN